jgi:hypothetical protein
MLSNQACGREVNAGLRRHYVNPWQELRKRLIDKEFLVYAACVLATDIPQADSLGLFVASGKGYVSCYNKAQHWYQIWILVLVTDKNTGITELFPVAALALFNIETTNRCQPNHATTDKGTRYIAFTSHSLVEPAGLLPCFETKDILAPAAPISSTNRPRHALAEPARNYGDRRPKTEKSIRPGYEA